MSDRKKPGMAFWVTVVVAVALVVYPLSFGPACWVAQPSEQKFTSILAWNFTYEPVANPPRVYFPLCWLVVHGPRPIALPLRRYAFLFSSMFLQIPGDWEQFHENASPAGM